MSDAFAFFFLITREKKTTAGRLFRFSFSDNTVELTCQCRKTRRMDKIVVLIVVKKKLINRLISYLTFLPLGFITE